MRMKAIEKMSALFQKESINLRDSQVIDVGGTTQVYLEVERSPSFLSTLKDKALASAGAVRQRKQVNVSITNNPLIKEIPNLLFFDKGFNADDIGASSDIEADFLKLENIQSILNKFDVEISFDTLEHVREPFKFCQNLASVTKSSGYIYLATVFCWEYHPSPQDFFRFSPDGLRECFQETDTSIIDVGWIDEGIDSFIFLKKN